jgi:hypothetical protein
MDLEFTSIKEAAKYRIDEFHQDCSGIITKLGCTVYPLCLIVSGTSVHSSESG